MGDYLSNLVDRSFTTLNVVQPQVASIFAPSLYTQGAVATAGFGPLPTAETFSGHESGSWTGGPFDLEELVAQPPVAPPDMVPEAPAPLAVAAVPPVRNRRKTQDTARVQDRPTPEQVLYAEVTGPVAFTETPPLTMEAVVPVVREQVGAKATQRDYAIAPPVEPSSSPSAVADPRPRAEPPSASPAPLQPIVKAPTASEPATQLAPLEVVLTSEPDHAAQGSVAPVVQQPSVQRHAALQVTTVEHDASLPLQSPAQIASPLRRAHPTPTLAPADDSITEPEAPQVRMHQPAPRTVLEAADQARLATIRPAQTRNPVTLADEATEAAATSETITAPLLATSSRPVEPPRSYPARKTASQVSTRPETVDAQSPAHALLFRQTQAEVRTGLRPANTSEQGNGITDLKPALAIPVNAVQSRSAARASESFRELWPQESAPPTQPTIQVTIGRVEVRATPAPPPPAKRNSPVSPVMSLDDYLRSRTGGRR